MTLIFKSFPDLERVILFGSRAKKTHKPASDVDLALIYPKEDYHLVASLKYKLEEDSKIPYFFDVLDLKNVASEELKEHVRLHGVEIYSKTAS